MSADSMDRCPRCVSRNGPSFDTDLREFFEIYMADKNGEYVPADSPTPNPIASVCVEYGAACRTCDFKIDFKHYHPIGDVT